MAYEIIDPVHHADVKIGRGLAIDQLAGLNHCWIGISEIPEAACDFPLVFMKSEDTGQFRLVALMGFQSNQNLYVMDGQFGATYLPFQFARAPFALAKTETGDLVAAIDFDHPRARDPSGAALFDQSGNESSFLSATRAKLSANVQDQNTTFAFIETLLKQDLLAPLLIDLDPMGDVVPIRIGGLYTISRAKLAHLSDSVVVDMHRLGALGAIYAIANSLAQIVRLQQLHNAHAQHTSSVPLLRNVSVGLPD